MDATHIAAIILAAGSSSRMGSGRHKLLLPLAGRPVLAHVIDAALASQARPIVLVLGHQSEQVRSSIATYAGLPDIVLAENANYREGMSTSLQAGVRALLDLQEERGPSSPAIGGALVILGDQPLMTAQIIDTLISTWRTTEKPIIAPLYAGKRGNPVLFDASLFAELLETSGDEGGRSVVVRHAQEVAAIEMSNAMASYDVDTWEAYEHVLRTWKERE